MNVKQNYYKYLDKISMLIDYLFSKIRVFRFRLRYYYYRATIKYKNIIFFSDNSKKFQLFISKLSSRNYTKIIILGNAPNLSALSIDQYNTYNNTDNIFTVGLNKTYIAYNTDIVLWSDHKVMKDLLLYDKYLAETVFIFVSQLLDERRKSLKFWKKNKTFVNYPFKTLFKARTILVSALYLAYILKIKKIELYGISLDNGKYFYDNPNSREELEFLSKDRITTQYYGYTMQKITKEVLEYLISDGFEIIYHGESNFLSRIQGIKKYSLEER